jgi:hypothetical protein
VFFLVFGFENFGNEITLSLGTDGTTRIISGHTTSILPKTAGQQGQSLIKIQPSAQASVTAAPPTQQRVQILKGADGKIQVRGLMPGLVIQFFIHSRVAVTSTFSVLSPVPAIFPQPFLFHLLLSLPCCPTVFQYLTD